MFYKKVIALEIIFYLFSIAIEYFVLCPRCDFHFYKFCFIILGDRFI